MSNVGSNPDVVKVDPWERKAQIGDYEIRNRWGDIIKIFPKSNSLNQRQEMKERFNQNRDDPNVEKFPLDQTKLKNPGPGDYNPQFELHNLNKPYSKIGFNTVTQKFNPGINSYIGNSIKNTGPGC